MGSRRMRDLSRRPDVEIRAFDGRADRRQSAESRFGVKTFPSLAAALDWAPEALVISTPPGTKGPLVDLAFERGIHHFVEADIWGYGVVGRAAKHPELVCAPSLTFSFLPVFKALVDVVPAIGPLLGYQFTLAGDMNGWHPGEGTEYYGRHRDTAPAREMVPFELAWLARLFGSPKRVAGAFNQYNPRPGSFEDTWSLLMQLEHGGTGQVTVTMGCPHDFRRGWAFGAKGMVTWDINRGEIVLRGENGQETVQQHGLLGQIIEATYAAEIGGFVDAIHGRAPWTHSYAEYQHGLATLAAAETAARPDLWIDVQPEQEPTRVLAPAGP